MKKSSWCWLVLAFVLLATAASAQRATGRKSKGRRSASRPAAAPKAVRAVVVSVRDTSGGRFLVPQVQLPNAAVAARVNLGLADATLGEELERVPQPLTALAGAQQARTEFEARGRTGFVGSRYEVLYNDHNLLSVELTAEYAGEHPSATARHATFDLRTGRLLEVRDLVADTAALALRWHTAIGARVAEHLRKLATEYPQLAPDVVADVQRRLYWVDSTHTVQLEPGDPRFYDFALTPTALVLYYDFGFPATLQALQPAADYPFLYADLKNWLKPAGLLGFRR